MLANAAASRLLLTRTGRPLLFKRFFGAESVATGVLVSQAGAPPCKLTEHGSCGEGHAEGAVLPQLRDFLQRSLYDANQGYFTAVRANAPVGSLGRALAFPQLAGEDGYRRAVREVYDSLEVSSFVNGPSCIP